MDSVFTVNFHLLKPSQIFKSYCDKENTRLHNIYVMHICIYIYIYSTIMIVSVVICSNDQLLCKLISVPRSQTKSHGA